MAKLTLKDAYIVLDTGSATLGAPFNISDHCTAVTIDIGKDEVENTAFGSTTHTFQADGLRTLNVSIDVQADYAASDVDSNLWDLYDADTPIAIEIRPTSAAVSATNPKYTMTVSVQNFAGVSGTVGDLASSGTVTMIPTTGGLTRAIA